MNSKNHVELIEIQITFNPFQFILHEIEIKFHGIIRINNDYLIAYGSIDLKFLCEELFCYTCINVSR